MTIDLQNLFDTEHCSKFRSLSKKSRAKISAGVKANNACRKYNHTDKTRANMKEAHRLKNIALGRRPKSKDVRPLKTVDQWSNSLQADILALMESK